MQIVWLRQALSDLNGIEEFIEADNPTAARQIEQLIVRTVDLLAQQPNIGRSGRVSGTRELVIPGSPYIVAYTVVGSKVIILAVLHGARRWPDVL